MLRFFRKVAALNQTVLRPKRLYINPIHMQFEPSSRCNLNCVHCEHDKNRKNPKDANFDEFKIVYDSFQPLYLTLSGYGEPLMCSDLPEIISYSRNRGAQVNTTTNGILLKKYAQRLIDSRVNLVNVSLDAASEETYTKVRCSSVFHRIFQSIKFFDQLRRSQKVNVKLRLSFVIQKSNIQELANFVTLSKELGADSVLFQIVETGFIDYRANEVVGDMTVDQVRHALNAASDILRKLESCSNIKWIIQNLDMLWKHHILREENHNRQCWKPWHSVYVTVDGFIRPCCNFVTDDLNFGQCDEKGLQAAFNTKEFIAFRKSLAKGKRLFKPCKVCVPETLLEIVFREKF